MSRSITLGVIQTSYGTDLNANIEKTKAFIREAADKGGQVILPSELFQGLYFCVTQDERWFADAHPWREHPCVAAMAPLAAELQGGDPGLDLRTGRAALLQFPGDDRRGRGAARRLSQEPHPRRPRLSGKVLLPPRRYGLQSLGHEVRPHRHRHMLGPMVSGSRARHGADGRRGPALSHRHRLRAP